MASGNNLTKGVIHFYDGRVAVHYVSGFAEMRWAARKLGLTTADLVDRDIPIDFMPMTALRALIRQGEMPADTDFEVFVEQIASIEVEEDPESQAPPAP